MRVKLGTVVEISTDTDVGKFVTMNSNRSINGEVVHDRVQANLDEYDRKDRYCEFGQINLLILDSDPSMTFLIMDGQVPLCVAVQYLVFFKFIP
jgi:hypothetical protein